MTSAAADNNKDDDASSTMLAFCIEKAGDTKGRVMRVPKPVLDDEKDMCIIRVLRAGVCNTDLEILQGYMGFSGVLGHEFVGVVEAVAAGSEECWIGQRVCGDINVGCNQCDVCHNATQLDACCSKMSRNHCPNRTVLGILNHHGTMAEYLKLPLRNLHKVPADMPDQVAVFSEPLAAACRIVEQNLVSYDTSSTRRVDKVAILGDGKLGLMIAEVLGREYTQRVGGDSTNNKYDAAPILFGKHLHKLELVKESGVQVKLVSECQDAAAAASSMNGGALPPYAGRFDVVVDATGSPAGLALAAGLCRPMGTLVLKSTCAAGEQFNAAPFVIDELKVVGSRCGPIDKALQLLHLPETNGSSSVAPLRVSKYITKTFPLAEADQAIQCAAEKSTMKVQIICSTSSTE